MADMIPPELVVEVLLWLPVSTLLRFRLVSKQWRALIDSFSFRKSHSNRHSHSVMIACNYLGAYYADLDSLWDCSTSTTTTIAKRRPPILKKIRYPRRECVDFNFRVAVGPCNGVFCIVTATHGVFFWNPFTRKHFKIALPPHQPPRSDPCCYRGLGYDSNRDDYKLVVISRLTYPGVRNLGRFVVWVYSVKLGFWKNIGDLPYAIYTSQALFVGGALHWKAKVPRLDDDPICMIVALDVANLKWRLVPIPEYSCGYTNRTLQSMIVDGCLCVMSTAYQSQLFDFWIMKEYGVKESWTRLITSAHYPHYPGFVTPLTFVDNGKKLLFLDNRNFLVGYDFETRSFERVNHEFMPSEAMRCVYTPSLLLPIR